MTWSDEQVRAAKRAIGYVENRALAKTGNADGAALVKNFARNDIERRAVIERRDAAEEVLVELLPKLGGLDLIEKNVLLRRFVLTFNLQNREESDTPGHTLTGFAAKSASKSFYRDRAKVRFDRGRTWFTPSASQFARSWELPDRPVLDAWRKVLDTVDDLVNEANASRKFGLSAEKRAARRQAEVESKLITAVEEIGNDLQKAIEKLDVWKEYEALKPAFHDAEEWWSANNDYRLLTEKHERVVVFWKEFFNTEIGRAIEDIFKFAPEVGMGERVSVLMDVANSATATRDIGVQTGTRSL